MSSKKTLSIGDKVPYIELYDDRNSLIGIPLQTRQYTVLFFYPKHFCSLSHCQYTTYNL